MVSSCCVFVDVNAKTESEEYTPLHLAVRCKQGLYVHDSTHNFAVAQRRKKVYIAARAYRLAPKGKRACN